MMVEPDTTIRILGVSVDGDGVGTTRLSLNRLGPLWGAIVWGGS